MRCSRPRAASRCSAHTTSMRTATPRLPTMASTASRTASWSSTRRSRRRSNPPACEEIAAALGDGDELDLGWLHEVASGNDREGGGAAAQLGIEREEELVDEAGGEQVEVERGTALAEDRARPAPAPTITASTCVRS